MKVVSPSLHVLVCGAVEEYLILDSEDDASAMMYIATGEISPAQSACRRLRTCRSS
jgi:hypothetical protein